MKRRWALLLALSLTFASIPVAGAGAAETAADTWTIGSDTSDSAYGAAQTRSVSEYQSNQQRQNRKKIITGETT